VNFIKNQIIQSLKFFFVKIAENLMNKNRGKLCLIFLISGLFFQAFLHTRCRDINVNFAALLEMLNILKLLKIQTIIVLRFFFVKNAEN